VDFSKKGKWGLFSIEEQCCDKKKAITLRQMHFLKCVHEVEMLILAKDYDSHERSVVS
jgi:hypothetical protein